MRPVAEHDANKNLAKHHKCDGIPLEFSVRFLCVNYSRLQIINFSRHPSKQRDSRRQLIK